MLSGLFAESSVDIAVSNNEPNAVLSATPTSGPAPLTVQFGASLSADTETAAEDLIYQWDFGDGATANDAGDPGILMDTEHFYSKQADGTACTTADPCTFVAKLTVTDEGGKQGVDSVEIQVGNTKPIVNISHSALQGPAPFEVVFNAINSTDEDGDAVEVEWAWGDGTANETLPVTGAGGDGAVPHTYEAAGTYKTTAVLTDGRGGRTSWAGVSVIVTEPVEQSSEPRAIFTISPETQRVGEPVQVDAGNSFDRPPGDAIASYSWDWGDGTPGGSGVTATHSYTQPRQYTIVLTVADAEDPPNTNSTSKKVRIVGEAGELPGPANRAPDARFIVSGGPVSPNEGFVGDTLFTFNASTSSDPDGDALTFDWDFGDGSPRVVDGGAVVTHRFDRARTYVVQLTVKDTSNLAKNATQTIIVRDASLNEEPVPFITTGPRSGSAPLSLMFESELSFDPNGDPLAYAWYVSDTRSEVRLSVDSLGDWVGTIPDAASGDSTNEGPSATICPENNGGVRVFWTSIDCDARPSGTEDIEIRPSSNNGATLDAVFRSPGEFTVSLEVDDGLMVVRGDPEQVTVAARSVTTEPPTGGPVPGGGPTTTGQGGRRSTGICGFGMLIGLLGSLFGLTLMMAANRRFAKARNR